MVTGSLLLISTRGSKLAFFLYTSWMPLFLSLGSQDYLIITSCYSVIIITNNSNPFFCHQTIYFPRKCALRIKMEMEKNLHGRNLPKLLQPPDKLFSPHGLSTIDMMMADRIGGQRYKMCIYPTMSSYDSPNTRGAPAALKDPTLCR
jgi:hypothetical protein